jgi:hypothetical protein
VNREASRSAELLAFQGQMSYVISDVSFESGVRSALRSGESDSQISESHSFSNVNYIRYFPMIAHFKDSALLSSISVRAHIKMLVS